MKLFINDYQEGCLPEILQKMQANNYTANSGYGTDKICENARNLIKNALKNDSVDVHFVAGGTLTNKIVISSFLRPFEGVVCADTAHIATHETGAIESGGHKVLTVKNTDGKILPSAVKGLLITFDDKYLFAPGSANLTSEAQKLLDKVGVLICKKFILHHMIIEGHTDSYTMSSKQFPSNWELSSSRACSVAASTPSPVLAETKRISMPGLRIFAYAMTFSRSKSK